MQQQSAFVVFSSGAKFPVDKLLIGKKKIHIHRSKTYTQNLKRRTTGILATGFR